MSEQELIAKIEALEAALKALLEKPEFAHYAEEIKALL